MSVETGTSLEQWVLELPDDEAVCEWPEGCANAATWALVIDCGCSTPMCDAHRIVQELEARAYAPTAICADCGADVATWRWNKL